MKITIVQSEIEEAIRQYISNLMQVRDGNVITMEFTATRGDDGLIAAIDISPASKPSTSASTTSSPQASAPEAPKTRAPRAPREPVAESSPAADARDHEAPAAVEAEVTVRPSSTGVNDTNDDDDSVEGAKPLKPSIFSGMTRPSNSAPSTDAAA